MPAGCNCGPNSPLAQALVATACAAVLQSLPVSCHFRGCKVPLFRIVSGAISSELALPFNSVRALKENVLTNQQAIFRGTINRLFSEPSTFGKKTV